VSCTGLRVLLHAYLDGELGGDRKGACEEHLLVCPDCRNELAALRALRDALRDESLRQRPPPGLRGRLEAVLTAAGGPARPLRRRTVAWVAAAAALLLGIGVGLWAVMLGRRPSAVEERLAQEVTSAHARSLLAEHLLDKPSDDQHQVKPWFQRRLDFSPPVKNFADQGFRLEGGRLDYLDERPVAAVVYRCREHVINVFVWPAASAGDGELRTATRRGYQLAAWTKGGLHCWAVSDLNAEELAVLARLVRDAMP
jgi:anti-sigma factor RsiW